MLVAEVAAASSRADAAGAGAVPEVGVAAVLAIEAVVEEGGRTWTAVADTGSARPGDHVWECWHNPEGYNPLAEALAAEEHAALAVNNRFPMCAALWGNSPIAYGCIRGM